MKYHSRTPTKQINSQARGVSDVLVSGNLFFLLRRVGLLSLIDRGLGKLLRLLTLNLVVEKKAM